MSSSPVTRKSTETAETRRGSADARRRDVVDAALREFAARGYWGTTVAQVGAAAGISTAYVAKLFPAKESLFTAAIDTCFARIDDALRAAADRADADGIRDPLARLDALGAAYAELISDQTLLRLQVHAQSATHLESIRDALRAGLRRVAETAETRTGAEPADVQRFLAVGALCHLVVTAGLDEGGADWERLYAAGIQHP